VPAYGPQNDVTLKMPAFEWVHVQLHQQKGMISLSPPTICNSAQYSSGGKSKLGRITKAGDSYLRTLLVQGARSVLIGAGKRTDSFSRWVCMLVERRGYWRAVVAIAAKNARLCWASLHYGDDFRLYSVN
ncbi:MULTISPECIES: transposase, partial [Citrobacter freundii complex]